MPEPTKVSGLTKKYGSFMAISGIDLTISAGKVHALLGANGAGKSTLIKCMSGATAPSAGTITIAGSAYTSLTPRQAMDAGVAVIYQQFSLVPFLSIADNVYLGQELKTPGRTVRKRAQEEATAQLLERIGVELDPRTKVAALSVAQRQSVEIAKAVSRDARLLILDEPSASLASHERAALMELVAALRDSGMQILYITHLLDEVREIADEVTILRDGQVSLSGAAAQYSMGDLVEAISGRPAEGRPAPRVVDRDRSALRVAGLRGRRVGPVDFSVAQGEILAVFGLLGSGRTELLESLYGVRRATWDELTICGEPYRPRRPRTALENGIALVPAERMRQSLFPILSVADNVLAAAVSTYARAGVLRSFAREKAAYARVEHQLDIRTPSRTVPVVALSGGNQQKVAIGRWLMDELGIKVLLLDDPTQGIDVGTRAELYRLLGQMTHDLGLAVVLTSSYPEEIIAVADRALVLRNGVISAELSAANISQGALLRAAHGVEEQ